MKSVLESDIPNFRNSSSPLPLLEQDINLEEIGFMSEAPGRGKSRRAGSAGELELSNSDSPVGKAAGKRRGRK